MSIFARQLVLENERALLRPMELNDIGHFRPIALDNSIWQYTIAHIFNEQELQEYVATALRDREKGIRYPFTIIDKQSGLVAGSSSYLNISEHHSKVEIGASWLGSAFHRTGLNRASKYALLSFAFDKMGMERVEFKTGRLNLRSQKAIKALGAIEEGMLRSDTLMDNGTRRDTIYFSILRSEWPGVKSSLKY